jgi:hypothetical protein
MCGRRADAGRLTLLIEADMAKTESRMSVREQKAEALDTFVKAELARTKALDATKIAKLKALRLARDEQDSVPTQPVKHRTVTRKAKPLPRSS